MLEVVTQLLIFPLPFALLALVVAGTAGTNRGVQNLAMWLAVASAFGMLVVGLVNTPDSQADSPAPAPSPVVSDALQECFAAGGVQMALIDGAWKCITADQAG